MGCGISHLDRKYKVVAVPSSGAVDTSQKSDDKTVGSSKKDNKEEETVNTVPSLHTMMRNDSILYDPSARIDSLISDLKQMGDVLQDPKALHLFYRFLKETNWMDEVLQADANAEKSKKNLLKRANTSLHPFSIQFRRYCLLAERENRSVMQQDEMESQAHYLLHSLKMREAREEMEREGKEASLLDYFSKEAMVSTVAAMGLRNFLLSAEYKKMVSCNWILDVSAIKFKRSDSIMSKSTGNLRKMKSGYQGFSRMNSSQGYGYRPASMNHVPSVLSTPEDDPLKRQKNLLVEMLSKIDFQLFRSVLTEPSGWMSPFSSTVHQLPFALTVTCHDQLYDTWNIEYATPGYESMTKFPVSEVVGSDMNHLKWENSDPDQWKFMRTAMKHREPCKVVINHRKQSGDIFADFLALQPVFEHDIVPVSAQSSVSNFYPPSPSGMMNAAVNSVGAAMTSTSAFFGTSSQSIVPYNDNSLIADFSVELEDYQSPSNSPKGSGLMMKNKPSVPRLWPPSPSAAAAAAAAAEAGTIATATVAAHPTPTYQRTHKINNFRRCRRYIVVHTDAESPTSNISDLKLADDLLLLLRFIM